MGASGKKLPGHGARRKALSPGPSIKDSNYGPRPHPVALRAGQRFWPRAGERRRGFAIVRVDDRHAFGQREDGDARLARHAVSRLLAADADGRGRHFAFTGWVPGRRYRALARVVAVGDAATLVLPDWHPGHPIRLPAGLLRGAGPGDWVDVRADLGAASPATLQLDLVGVAAPPAEGTLPAITYAPPAVAPPGARRAGPDAIVFELAGAGLDAAAPAVGGRRELHTLERIRLSAGARVHLAEPGEPRITRYLELLSVRLLPHGCVLICGAEPRPLDRPIPCDLRRSHGAWRKVWWEAA
ncbi:hypothetical protein DSM104299_00530 [Baekduia alba]|uniref:hypothetical protein n=1 Tax=Baekduia alba TaxID=2997333 RepID=UPI0023405BA4|nr:hypothetical protein [Baekduia alba]WCB91852.1 hypothetical protein DSM104299_00530 [Baekduia alba]